MGAGEQGKERELKEKSKGASGILQRRQNTDELSKLNLFRDVQINDWLAFKQKIPLFLASCSVN